eukprot:GDKI01025804.1.p1 GENE.GDKI01025804.1~~GDKI01025804.1.p1  ORF type:complete len:254 (-),score=42.11 GDKI01025804.1:745-1506(-)
MVCLKTLSAVGRYAHRDMGGRVFVGMNMARRGFSCGAVDRAVREIPWQSRFDLLKQRKKPVYMSESIGTPRREYQHNVIDGIRVKPTFNPYVKLNNARRYVLENWESRNWDNWDPLRVYVRGSRRRYNVPEDIKPYKDELGEWHPPKLSGRYQADIEKQYAMNGLPWMWKKDFYEAKVHYHDREPLGPKMWYMKEFRQERVKEAMRKKDEITLEYRQELRQKRPHTYFEKAVLEIAGEEMAQNYVRQRKVPLL